jgi:hypothetical protein
LVQTLIAKYDYHVEVARLCWNTSYRSAPLEAQKYENGIYVFSDINKFTDEWGMQQVVIFGFMI